MRRHLAYAVYVFRHKWFVLLAGLRLGVPIWRLIFHDWTKFTRKEWGPYARCFYTLDGKHQYKESPEFTQAWNHHQKRMDHHYQHWYILWDRGESEPLPMSKNARKEMLADWMGAGRALGKPDTAAWYSKNYDKIKLHAETREWLNRQLFPEYDVLRAIESGEWGSIVWDERRALYVVASGKPVRPRQHEAIVRLVEAGVLKILKGVPGYPHWKAVDPPLTKFVGPTPTMTAGDWLHRRLSPRGDWQGAKMVPLDEKGLLYDVSIATQPPMKFVHYKQEWQPARMVAAVDFASKPDETAISTHPDVTEALADVSHDIWSHWMRWQFSICLPGPEGGLIIPPHKVERWKRQMETSYKDLSEDERPSDREQADKIVRALVEKGFTITTTTDRT